MGPVVPSMIASIGNVVKLETFAAARVLVTVRSPRAPPCEHVAFSLLPFTESSTVPLL